jgi:uncharacterized membrane protein (UPF0127 family)
MLIRDGRMMLTSEGGDSVVCRLASSFWSRFIGLMGRPRPENGEGLLLRPCNSIHMFFMRFPLDVVFLDGDFGIVRIIRNLAPGKVVGTVPGAMQVLEIPAGELPSSFSEGSRLRIKST